MDSIDLSGQPATNIEWAICHISDTFPGMKRDVVEYISNNVDIEIDNSGIFQTLTRYSYLNGYYVIFLNGN